MFYVSPSTVESTRHAVSQIINCSTICGFKSTFSLNHYRSFEYYIGDEDLKTSVYQPHRTRFTTIRELLYHNSSSASVLSKLLRTAHTRLSAHDRTIGHRSIHQSHNASTERRQFVYVLINIITFTACNRNNLVIPCHHHGYAKLTQFRRIWGPYLAVGSMAEMVEAIQISHDGLRHHV